MQQLLTPERYAKLRSGPQRPIYRRPDPEAGALFVRRRPLRSMTVLVDHDLTSEAAGDPQIAYLLGLMSAPDRDATPTTPQLRRYWYADEGPPSSSRRKRTP